MNLTTRPNIAAICPHPTLREITLSTRPPLTPSPNHLLLLIHTVGICGSDVHYWSQGKCGSFTMTAPLILGHETSAVVVGIGEGVHCFEIGDRVAVEPGVPCRVCECCRAGRYNLCPDVRFLGTPPYDGSLRTYIEHPADFCYRMPEHMSFEEGALLEPLSVGIHACQRGGVVAGSHVLITGAGPIGLVCLLAARASGATFVAITDVMENRLEVARELGADLTVVATDGEIGDILGQHRFTHTFECSGAEPALVLAIKQTAPGGKIMSIGRSAKPNQNIPLFEAADKEIDIIGSFRYKDTYPIALELVASGQINVKPLVTHHYTLSSISEAFETAETGRDGAIKVCIQVYEE